MKTLGALIITLTLSLATSKAAHAKSVEYLSQHPVPHKFGGGFCTIDVPHVHNYPPGDPRMFRETNGQFYFVGDPAPFEYDGPRYAYYGAHPVVGAEAQFGHPIYCYIKGPHYHWYQPPPQAPFQLSGGAYWYVGNFPPSYYNERPRYAVINDAYAPMPYARPVVDVQVAPAMVRAEISIGGPGWRASAVVGGPPAPVYVPPPPPPPSPGPAVQIGVGINFGGPPAVVERREIIERREGYEDRRRPHDHGRHEGWRSPFHVDERRPPSRYVAGPAPVRQPLFNRSRPQPRPGMGPRFLPAARPAPGPAAPMRGPAPTAPSHGSAPMRGPAPVSPSHATGAPTRGPAPNPPQRRDDQHR
jgi:hypothetical protein